MLSDSTRLLLPVLRRHLHCGAACRVRAATDQDTRRMTMQSHSKTPARSSTRKRLALMLGLFVAGSGVIMGINRGSAPELDPVKALSVSPVQVTVLEAQRREG